MDYCSPLFTSSYNHICIPFVILLRSTYLYRSLGVFLNPSDVDLGVSLALVKEALDEIL